MKNSRAKQPKRVRQPERKPRKVESVGDVNTNTPEGKMLIIAMAKLSTMEGNTHKTPCMIIAEINQQVREVF